jgi:hypothetical protein
VDDLYLIYNRQLPSPSCTTRTPYASLTNDTMVSPQSHSAQMTSNGACRPEDMTVRTIPLRNASTRPTRSSTGRTTIFSPEGTSTITFTADDMLTPISQVAYTRVRPPSAPPSHAEYDDRLYSRVCDGGHLPRRLRPRCPRQRRRRPSRRKACHRQAPRSLQRQRGRRIRW